MPREQLLVEVWGYHQRSVSRAVDHAVSRLRRKIEVDPARPRWIVSVRGAGYRLQPAPARGHEVPDDTSRPVGFVGRTRELAALRAKTARGGVVTVHGPPGVGKTRLCREHLATVPIDQQAFVRLRGARTGDDVREAVATALGAELPEGAEPEVWLARVLAHRAHQAPFQLVLDNAEHVLEPVGDLIRVARAHAGDRPLIVLVTSRRTLGLADEQCLDLEPLGPGPAVELLVARARQVRWSYAPDAREREHLAALATRELDGLPLALELAASRLALFGANTLAEQLTDRFAVLTGDRGEAGWGSLEAALAWSWERLPPDERAALSACTVFEDSFEVAAAERVIGAGAADALASLVDRALVVVEGESVPQLRLLTSVRQFVARRAPPSDETPERLRTWLVEQVTPLADELGRRRRAEALALLERLAPDLRAALRDALGVGALDHAVEIGVALAELGIAVGRPRPVLPWLEAALAQLSPADPRGVRLRLAMAGCLAEGGRGDEVVERLAAAASADTPTRTVIRARRAAADDDRG
ncbi:MAG: winged helix-turn-helix domain-containing protein, partial [Bacteroidota bacterium]